jgi:putative chitinase
MHITELDSFKLSDAVKFHNRLNPKIWGRDEHLLPEVREKLLAIADNFREFLGVGDLDVKDITISGSNAAYNYTPYSDIDLHLVVAFPASDEIYQELFNAKKYQYNDEHNLAIGGVPVELYVQNADEPPVSQGEYSVTRNEWIQVPRRKRAQVDDTCVRAKVEDLDARIHSAIQSGNADSMGRLWDKIKAMRKSGLDEHGEFGCENIVFKILRNKGCIKELRSARTAAQDRELSLKEQNRPQERKVWGFGEGSLADMRAAFARDSQPTAPSKVYRSPEEYAKAKQLGPEELKKLQRIPASYTPVSVREQDQPNTVSLRKIIEEFFGHVAKELGIKNLPTLRLRRDPEWTRRTGSFGQYNPESNELDLATSGRHVLDILRTMAHELTHCKQGERGDFPDWAGETGSPWEDEANAMAGRIMRGMAERHPEYFADIELTESSGYIPTWAQRNDPRFEMALSVDVHPGQTGREANKMSLETDAQGHPQLLRADGRVSLAESLSQELKIFEEQDLFEINMGSKNLRKEAAKTGAIAGMEFEMIVPGMESDDPEMEPDYDSDERCRSIEDAVRFFHDGDYNGRREVERLRERMQNDFLEWRDDKLRDDWGSESEDYLRDWLRNNVNDDEWNPDELTGDERNEVFDEFAANVDADPSSDYYNQAFDEWREEFQDNYDESDWLDAEDLDLMSGIENAYEISWPHWTNMNSGEIDADQVADEFSRAVGREVRVNTRYHQSGDRPGPNNQFYIVEPDASLDGDNDGDEGLEFVSPPMPIDELLKDLNAVKEWAGRMGVYTNSSTGLHINISVPNYSIDRLDYVKLALLLGDEYVLNQFGRASNTYTKSALGKVRDRVRSNPEDAQRLLDKMKGQMGELASKAIHSGSTDKYTSINTKDGHIEFRSPGGDWLDDNFDKIENTLLRFTVAMSAALNPEAYREEYQKKLYKLLTQDQKGSDTIKYFADYVAGKIPKAALRSFVKQAQLQRKEKRGETSGEKMWWRVSNPGNSYASVEVVASSKEEAIEKALGDDGYPSWANTRQSIVAEPVRPYEEKPAQPAEPQGGRPNDPNGRYAIVPRSDPALYGSSTSGTPDYQFRFNMGDPAAQAQGRYVLQAWAARNNVVAADYMVVDTEQWDRSADAASGGIIDVEPDIEVVYPGSTAALAQQRATPGTFSGAWKILVNGEEVYRFSGVGNNQSDANRVAAQWLRNNGRGVSGEGFEVYPIMTESLAESASDYKIHDRPKLDRVLAKCCRMVVQGQQQDPERYGQVAACVIDPDNRMIYGINLPARDGTRRHAERVAIDKYRKSIGEIPAGSIIVTTCSPCNSPMEERHGKSCKDLLNSVGIHKVYAGYQDPTQHDDSDADFRVYVTENDQLWSECQQFAQTFLGSEELAEDWKSALATGAMAGAMAMGAHAKVPEIVRQAVEPGDTVYSIARQNNVNPLEIYKLNKLDRNTKLEIGQKILVPDYSKPAAAAPTTKPLPTKSASKSLPNQDKEVTLLSTNSDAEAALQTAAKAAGLRGSELAQFMAQTRHESWDFSKMKEVGNKQRFAKYEQPRLAKQLGNKVKGDGERFKGRGFIQLTGRDNYTRASKQIFGDDRLVKNPDLASRLDVGAQIALWFWKNQVRPNVSNFNNTTEVVKAINAAEPMHVVQQRHNKFKEYLAVL